MRLTIISTPAATCTFLAAHLVASATTVSMAAWQERPDRDSASTASTATGCLREAEAPGDYVLTTTSIEQPGSGATEPEGAARARPPQRTEVPPPVPGGKQAPESSRAEGKRDVPGPSDDVVSLRLIFSPGVDASGYVGQRVEVKGALEDPSQRHGTSADAGETGTRAGTAGSTETTGQTGSVSATGQTAETARGAGTSKMSNTERLTLRVASVRTLSPRCEDGA